MEEYNDQIEGRNAVLEYLESGKDINKILVATGEKHGSINKIIAIAKDRKIIITEIEKSKLNKIAQTENSQGVIANVPPYDYCEVEDILQTAEERKEKPFIIILDGIEDPHNLGSIIRTAETAGVHGIIIPKRRACGVNSTVSKVSAGAVQHMKIARVNNINETIKFLKQNDIWICGTDGQAKTYYYQQDFKMPVAIIIGSEGYGMSRLVKENCDFLVKIPMKGKITSLNASVSAGIVMYEVTSRGKIKKRLAITRKIGYNNNRIRNLERVGTNPTLKCVLREWNMSSLEEKIEKLVEPKIVNLGYELYDVQYVKEGKDYFLRIFIDNSNGISLEDCEKVNNAITDLLDDANYIKQQYFFEVSSPGVERILRKDKHLKDNIGEKIEIKLFKPINKKKEIIGILEQINEKAIIVISDNEEQEILRQDIAQIKKAYEW